VRSADRAVTANYSGFEWKREELQRKVDAALAELELLSRPARTIPPGRYCVYLAPAALSDFLGLLGWGGFGLRAHRSKTTPLLRMIEQGQRLHPSVRLVENTCAGLAPDFQEEGFLRPDQVPLIESGAYRECLASPRSAAEYGVPTNGAFAAEMPHDLLQPELVDLVGGQVGGRRLGQSGGVDFIAARHALGAVAARGGAAQLLHQRDLAVERGIDLGGDDARGAIAPIAGDALGRGA
jgi:hypothetical protein